MTEISKDRIERAARQMARTAYRMDQDAAGKPCAESEEDAAANHFWCDFERTAESALMADAPALLGAKIEGLREARDIVNAEHLGEEPDNAADIAYDTAVDHAVSAIDQRIAQLSSQGEGR